MRFCRRTFLKVSIVAAVTSIAAALGFPMPRLARAAEWPRDAFSAETVDDALRNLYGTRETIASSAVKIRAPLRTESGAVVPVTASANLPNVRAVSILIEKNAQPLAAHISLSGGIAYFSTNIRMASTSDVLVVVSSDGKLYATKQTINVRVGA